MKKNLIEMFMRCKKTMMVTSTYILLVTLFSVGMVGCSKEKTTGAATTKESVTDSNEKKTAAKTNEVSNTKETQTENETVEKKKTEETTKTDSSGSTGKAASSGSNSNSSTKKPANSNASTTTKKETSSSESSSGSSSSSKTETTTKKEEPAAHTHSWKPVYKEVDNGRWGKELVKDAWTEEVPTYTMVWVTRCNGCGMVLSSNDDIDNHFQSQLLLGKYECGGYTSRQEKVQNGTKTVEHPAEYKDVWIPKMEKVIDYHKCSCGATK